MSLRRGKGKSMLAKVGRTTKEGKSSLPLGKKGIAQRKKEISGAKKEKK